MCTEFAGQRDHDHGDEQGRPDEKCDGDDRGNRSGGGDDVSQRCSSRRSEQSGIFADDVECEAIELWEIVFVHGGWRGVCAAAVGAEREYRRQDAQRHRCGDDARLRVCVRCGCDSVPETIGINNAGNGRDVGGERRRQRGDIFPDIGILGTPVIDPTTETIYVVTKTKTSSTNYIQRLHALNLTTGAETTNSPVTIAATFPGTCEGGSTNTFNPLTENQRPGLALSNGMVYISWASHGDQGAYHGWILGYQTANLAAVPTVFNVTPNAAPGFAYCRGGIWMSGGAPAFDAAGNMYVVSGNGAFDGTSGSAALPTDFSEQLHQAEYAEHGSARCWPTSRTDSSCADSLLRVGTAETSTADASSRLRLNSSFTSSSQLTRCGTGR